MKKVLSILMILLLLVGLCACGNENAEDVSFKNDLKSVIHGVHISASSSDSWSDPLNYAQLSVGSTIHIDFEKFAGDSPVYDVGIIDENGVNYDIYEVTLTIGDALVLSGDENGATLTITGKDGSVKTYDAYVY